MRRSELHRNTEAIREWQQRSRKPLQRTGSLADRRKRLPAMSAKAKARRRDERNLVEIARAFKLAVCGSLSPELNAHHCLPKRWLEREARSQGLTGDALLDAVYDPQVAICLFAREHEQHTNRTRVIGFERLPEELVAYVSERWGEPGIVALEREHPWGGSR